MWQKVSVQWFSQFSGEKHGITCNICTITCGASVTVLQHPRKLCSLLPLCSSREFICHSKFYYPKEVDLGSQGAMWTHCPVQSLFVNRIRLLLRCCWQHGWEMHVCLMHHNPSKEETPQSSLAWSGGSVRMGGACMAECCNCKKQWSGGRGDCSPLSWSRVDITAFQGGVSKGLGGVHVLHTVFHSQARATQCCKPKGWQRPWKTISTLLLLTLTWTDEECQSWCQHPLDSQRHLVHYLSCCRLAKQVVEVEDFMDRASVISL